MRGEADFPDHTGKGAARPGFDRERRRIALAHATHICLVDIDLEVEAPEVFRNNEQGLADTGTGDRLAWGDVGLKHDALDW
ncbi:hypothetical protein D3C86_1792150 [compost metagenome]